MFESTATEAPTWRAELNDAQRAAVEHGDGPLLVVAGAGSGKTKTLACRVAHLVESGVPPERILLLTFTRRAAQEMLDRAARLTASRTAARVWGGTFHAVGNRLLRVHGSALGLAPNFTVMDTSDTADCMNLVRSDLGLGSGKRRFPKKETLAAVYSRTVNAGEPLSDVLEKQFPWCRDETDDIVCIFEGYTQRKQAQGVLDFDDLLMYWLALLRVPSVGPRIGSLFDHVLVDEYQDTNSIQAEILRGLRSQNDNVMVVGDDAQSIYSFRAATVRSILDFPVHFPGTRIVTLEQNYRSTQPILEASNALIAGSRHRHDKTLWTLKASDRRPLLMTCMDEAQQSQAVCDRVLADRELGVPLRRQAVLFRTGHHSAHLEIELARRNIPFVKFGGLRFIEASHVKDVLALLRVLENPADELAWFRVLQLVEGVGPTTASRVMNFLGIGGAPRAELGPLRKLIEAPPAVPSVARSSFEGLRSALGDCAPPGITVASQIERLASWCSGAFERMYENPAVRIADLAHLAGIASGYESRARFIAELALDPPASTGDLAGPPLLDDDFLILSTIHSAKGCEWDVVHVIHAADGMIPSDMATGDEDAIEEERRLLYVALTRARDALLVYWPLRYYHRRLGVSDAHSYGQVSRFITAAVAGLFERRSLAPPAADESIELSQDRGIEGVTNYLSALWRS